MWLWITPAIVVIAAVALFLVLRSRRKSKSYAGAEAYRSLLGASGTAAAAPIDPKLEPLRQNLRVKLLYQEDKIDAAIALERERNPAGTPEDWYKAAIARWERDNR